MNTRGHICLKGQLWPHNGQVTDQTTWWLFQDLPTPAENSMPSGPSTSVIPQEGTSPVPDPSQPTRRLIRLSSPERQRLSSLNLTPDPELEPPPKPPRSCAALARQALEGSFVGWGVPGQSPQGICFVQTCSPRVGMRWVALGFLKGECWGMEREAVGLRPCLLCSVVVAMEEEEEQSPSSSDEEKEAEETVALDSDTEQVRRRNLATSPAEASTHPLNRPHHHYRKTYRTFPPLSRSLRLSSHPVCLRSLSLSLLPELTPSPAQEALTPSKQSFPSLSPAGCGEGGAGPTADWPDPAIGSADLGQELRHHEQVPNMASDSDAQG